MPPLTAQTHKRAHTWVSSTHLSFHLKISLHMITVTLVLLTAAHYKPMTLMRLHHFSTASQSFTGAAHATVLCRGKSVKMAVLIRWRIRAVIFNQSSPWQNLWCSRDDRDDDSCWRVKHQKYTCTLICSRWSRAYSAMSVLRAAFWEGRWKGSCRNTLGFTEMLLAPKELGDTAK